MSTKRGGTDEEQLPRAGAMTTAMRVALGAPERPKVLRIGLMRRGKIIEERIVRTRETVTVGTSERNHFTLAGSGLPPRFELFKLVRGTYFLNFTAEMEGKAGIAGEVRELAQWRRTLPAQDAGRWWRVELDERSRGKVVLGDTALLFQFIRPPAAPLRPQMPAAVRGGLAKSIDWLFTGFVVFSFMVHFGFVVYLENADWEIEPGLSALPKRYAKLILQEPEPPEPPTQDPVVDAPEVPSDEVAEVDEPARDEAPDRTSKTSEGPSSDARPADVQQTKARIADEASAAATALMVGALGADEGGALADLMRGGALMDDAEDVLAGVGGVVPAADRSADTLRPRGGGVGPGERTAGLGALEQAPGGTHAAAEGNDLHEARVQGRVTHERGGDIGGVGDFDVSKVTAMVRRNLRAIRLCYEKQLRRDPNLGGKVVVEFTIVERGTVSHAEAVENTTGSAAVAACVVQVIDGFRFRAGPQGGSVTYAYPFVFAPQN